MSAIILFFTTALISGIILALYYSWKDEQYRCKLQIGDSVLCVTPNDVFTGIISDISGDDIIVIVIDRLSPSGRYVYVKRKNIYRG